uniref:Uncharacterized protein n=1 Tax=Bacillus subtilis (strain 168) TaxID=224308 RepID=P94471_BACSU|nr:unknown [Bacillus subtilis subsp. subtilis str. 168]
MTLNCTKPIIRVTPIVMSRISTNLCLTIAYNSLKLIFSFMYHSLQPSRGWLPAPLSVNDWI